MQARAPCHAALLPPPCSLSFRLQALYVCAAMAAVPRGGNEGRSEAALEAHEEPEEGALVAAVIDNRAGEVGLAVLDADGGTLLLAQHVESTRTFALTLCAPLAQRLAATGSISAA